MKRVYFVYAAVICLLLYSCQTVNQISIDYLVPADFNFPEQIKRVGIINTVSQPSGPVEKSATEDTLTNIPRYRYLLNGDSQIVTNALAEAIADQNYFDQVVINDSIVHADRSTGNYLDKEIINALAEDLEVDMLIALESIQISVKRMIYPMGGIFLGVIDAKVYPRISLYIPNRSTPLVMINASDSIFWEDYRGSQMAAATKIIPDDDLIIQASEFAGTIPIKYMIPYWETANRFIFTSGSPEMRDAGVFVNSNDWEKAMPLWEKVYQTTSKKKLKAYAASNLSLYYEMKDDFDTAEEWGQKAILLISGKEENAEEISEIKPLYEQISSSDLSYVTSDYARIFINQSDLAKRKVNFLKLKMQMNRFNDDF